MSERQNVTLQKPPPLHETRHGITRVILEEFNNVTRRSDDPPKSFICHYDLKKIWKDKDRIKAVLHPDDIPPSILDVIQKTMFTILSVLVSIGAQNCLAEFRKRLFESNGRYPRFTDSDIPLERDKIDFLAEEPALLQQFFEQQHKFSPVVISLEELQTLREYDPLRRLPFETITENLGSGAFSDVKLVGIPPRYFKEVGGSDYDQVYKVACKKIHVDKNFKEEVDTLQILKESLTSQDHILKHLATIKHGFDRYILLPYASLGDLYQFLHCGRDVDDDYDSRKYNFKDRFREIPDPGSGDVSRPLLKQCRALAGALKWLHSGLDIESSSNSSTVYCAHMDLKPDNILIQPDGNSIVGKWMISDFGISVVHENKRTKNSNIVSVRDWYEWYERHSPTFTLNTQPKRNSGTYQAPEVKFSEQRQEHPVRPAAGQQGVGRKNDIWSYGCIFSEVLAWALGRDGEVENFHRERMRNRGDDYFFDSKFLGPQGGPDQQFEVRRSVIDWLNRVRDESRSPHKWVRCWADTIKNILIVNPAARPSAERLVDLVEHVKYHEAHSRDNTPIECPYLSTSVREARMDSGSEVRPTPSIAVVEPELKPQSQPVPKPVPAPVPNPEPVSKPESEPEPHRSRSMRSLSTYNTKPPHAHGIFINPNTPTAPTAQNPVCWNRVRGVVVDVALSHEKEGTAVAFLMEDLVQIYKISLQDFSVTYHRKFELPRPSKWEHAQVSFAGGMLAVWGYCAQRKKKLLCLRNVDEPGTNLGPPISEGVEMLKTVAISPQGVVALVRREDIVIKRANSDDVRLSPRPRQKFAHAAFNDVGNLLFAWAYDKTESLYVWRVNNGVIETVTESESHYPSEERSPSTTKVIPYNTYHGCIIAAPEQRFFPAQMRSSLIDNNDDTQLLLNRHDIRLKDVQTGCVFQDHSFVALERKTVLSIRGLKDSFCLKEYEIEYQAHHFLQRQGPELCKLTSRAESASQLRVLECGADLVAVVCYQDGEIEFVRFSHSG